MSNIEVDEKDKEKIRKIVNDIIRNRSKRGRPSKEDLKERKRREKLGISRPKKRCYKMTKTQKEKTCPICGVKFVPEKGNKQKTCGSSYCKIRNNEIMLEERLKKKKLIKNMTRHICKDMTEDAKRRSEIAKKMWDEHPERREQHRQAALERWNKKRELQGNTKLTPEELEKRTKTMKESRLRRALISETLKQVLEEINPDTGKSNVEEMSMALIKRVVETGDPAAATFIRDTTGEKPKTNEHEGAMMVMFAPPSQLLERGDAVVDAEFKEVDEKEQYLRLKAKFENQDTQEVLALENNND